MLLIMVVFMALTMGSGNGPMGMMGHGTPDQHVDHKQAANPAADTARPSAEK